MIDFQVKPARQFVMSNDPITQKIFNGATKIAAGGKISRKKILICWKSGTMIFGEMSIENLSADKEIKLNEFDRAVFDAVISELSAGNICFTTAMLYRELTGVTTRAKNDIPEAIGNRINGSIGKFFNLKIWLDLKEVAEKSKYNIDNKTPKGWLIALAMAREDLTINGAKLDNAKIAEINGVKNLAFVVNGALLFDVASSLRQVIRLAVEDIEIPVKVTSWRVIAVKHYLIRRVAQIVGSHESADRGRKNRRLAMTITFSNLMKCCGFRDLNRYQRRDIRNIAAKILDAFKEKKKLTFWQFEKNPAGEIVAITFKLPASSCENNN